MTPARAIYKTCSCGRTYTVGEWLALPWLGVQRFPADGALAMRNSAGCGSTLCVPIVVDARRIAERIVPSTSNNNALGAV